MDGSSSMTMTPNILPRTFLLAYIEAWLYWTLGSVESGGTNLEGKLTTEMDQWDEMCLGGNCTSFIEKEINQVS